MKGGLAAAARRREAAVPKPAEPATNTDWWARIEELRRRQTEALAERTRLKARLGVLTLAAAGKGGGSAEAELAQVRSRLAAIAGVEQEVAAALEIAEARRGKAGEAESIARRQRARDRAAELGEDRRLFADGIDYFLSELQSVLAGYVAAGRMQVQTLHSAGARAEAGPSDPTDGIRVADAVVRLCPTLVRMLRERGFSPSVIPADSRQMKTHEAIVQNRVESALEQAARADLRALTPEAA